MFSERYAKLYNLFNSNKPYESEVKFVYEWAEKPKSIFDIGCGTGHYWEFYPKETQVVGIERSRSMSKAAKSTAKNVVCADITKYKHQGLFDCATALFDVLNYIPQHGWWHNIPIRKDGYFIFDVWDKTKALREGFTQTQNTVDGNVRVITPMGFDGNKVDLRIDFGEGVLRFREIHRMYLFSDVEIKEFCGKEFEIVDKKETDKWQTWYKCKRL